MDLSTSFSINPESIELNYTLPILPPGQNVATVAFKDLDKYMKTSITWGILYGVDIGSSIITLLLLVLVIKNRRNPMFWLNCLNLVLLTIKSALNFSYILGPLSSLAFAFTGMLVPDTYYTYYNTIAANAVHTVLIGSIEAALTYQIFIVFRSPEVRNLGISLAVASGCIALTVFALYIHSTVKTAQLYHHLFQGDGATTERAGGWVNNVPFIMFSASVNVTSILLISKLALAIKTRRHLGLKQFGSLHILLIMATQTLMVPSVLTLINYKNSKVQSTTLAELSILLVVISLPLTSMWASSANNSPQPSSSSVSFLYRSSSNDSENSQHSSGMHSATTLRDNMVYSLSPQKLDKLQNSNHDMESASLKTRSQPTTTTIIADKKISGSYDEKSSPVTLTSEGDISKVTQDSSNAASPTEVDIIDRMLDEQEKHGFISPDGLGQTLRNVNDDEFRVTTSHFRNQ